MNRIHYSLPYKKSGQKYTVPYAYYNMLWQKHFVARDDAGQLIASGPPPSTTSPVPPYIDNST